MASKIKYAPLYFDNRKQLLKLSDEQRGKLMIAILDFAAAYGNGEEFTLSEDYGLELTTEIVFDYMCDGIVRLYETSTKRTESGSIGGKAESKSKQSEANVSKVKQTEANLSKSKQTQANLSKLKQNTEDYDYDKDYDEEKDYDNDDIGAELTLPLNTGDEFPVFQSDIDEYSRLYPSVDILQEFRKMRGWLLANPSRRKTKNGIARFINSWLSREQDKGGTVKREKSFIEVAAEMEADYDG